MESIRIAKIGPKGLTEDGDINISVGGSRHETSWKNKTIKWSQFLAKLQNPVKTYETVQAYKQMAKGKRDQIKDVGGFVGGFLKEGRRKAQNVQNRSIITLDADSVKTDIWSDMSLLADYCIAYYTTHSHTKKAPRYRFIIPLTRPVTVEEYEPIARKIADTFGIDNFDDTTYQAERLMFWPSHSKDGEYIFDILDNRWLDPDEILGEYVDWKDSSYWPESSRSKGIRKSQAEKQGDPLEKKGVIGAFCRTYDIVRAIETFLPETYLATDKPGRYTYVEGSTHGGLVLYDDKFAYSHHSTDPVGDLLVNAFDLVRIHKFGHLDEDVKPTTNITKYPSFTAMREFASKDEEVKHLIVKEQFDKAQDDFADFLDDEDDQELNTDKEVANTDWMKSLEIDKNGVVEASAYNLEVIMRNDPNLKDRIYLDEFANRVVLRKNLPWRKVKQEKFWKDSDDAGLRVYLEKTYNIVAKGKIEDALMQEMERNRFHPVRDYLDGLDWDGQERVETLLIERLGAEDTEYTRVVTRKFLTAAVARIYRPGIKFDHMIVTSGPQGIGKTLLPTKLAKEWFSNSLEDVRGKDAYEALQGVWIMEMGEMTATRKADVEATKHFISKQEDQFRMAYGKRKSYFKRQCVFWGTSNDPEFLKDRTGNRRFWPVDVRADKIVPGKEVWELSSEEIDQIWAEAKHLWENGETLYLDNKEEAMAKEVQERHTDGSAMVGQIEEYLEIPITEDWYDLGAYERKQYIQQYLDGDETGLPGDIERTKVCVADLMYELFNTSVDKAHPAKVSEIRNILANLDGWEKYSKGSGQLRFGKAYGRQVAYVKKVCEI